MAEKNSEVLKPSQDDGLSVSMLSDWKVVATPKSNYSSISQLLVDLSAIQVHVSELSAKYNDLYSKSQDLSGVVSESVKKADGDNMKKVMVGNAKLVQSANRKIKDLQSDISTKDDRIDRLEKMLLEISLKQELIEKNLEQQAEKIHLLQVKFEKKLNDLEVLLNHSKEYLHKFANKVLSLEGIDTKAAFKEILKTMESLDKIARTAYAIAVNHNHHGKVHKCKQKDSAGNTFSTEIVHVAPLAYSWETVLGGKDGCDWCDYNKSTGKGLLPIHGGHTSDPHFVMKHYDLTGNRSSQQPTAVSDSTRAALTL